MLVIKLVENNMARKKHSRLVCEVYQNGERIMKSYSEGVNTTTRDLGNIIQIRYWNIESHLDNGLLDGSKPYEVVFRIKKIPS